MDLIDVLLVLIIFQCMFAGSATGVTLSFSLNRILLEPGDTSMLDVVLSSRVSENITVSFLYQEDDRILPYQMKPIINNLPEINLMPENTRYEVLVVAKGVGEVLIHMNASTSQQLEASNLHVDVRVINSFEEEVLGRLCGWIYLVAWSLMQLPQIYLSWKHKSLEGVSLDFVHFNTIGNIAYTLYNCLLFFVDSIKTVYRRDHPFGLIPVELNDVICSIFMTFISFVQVGQCFIYETGKQHLSRLCMVILAVLVACVSVMLILTLVNIFIWLTFLTALSYLKVISAPAKYIPQIVYNYKRSSTEGWSVYFSWLDLIGGIGSVAQMILNAQNQGDWSSLWGNMPKFLLGAIHIIFDLILLFQHFVLYRNLNPYEKVEGLEESKAMGKTTSSDGIPPLTEKSKILQ